jgi:hypothetical protein
MSTLREAKEVVGGYAVYRVKSKDEALAWTRRFLDLQHWKGCVRCGRCSIPRIHGRR